MLFFRPPGCDPCVASRARDQAHWLIRDHGDAAEAVIAAKIARPSISDADRYRYRLTAKVLRSLRKAERRRRPLAATAVTVWQPRLFSAERLLRLFGVGAVDRRKRPRT